mmetsp:Transcript_15119/g.53074  ORF Transcript_15119/g.53074 Transcript_15119/m.53074 type:complete len:453 (+) Transcript_15119:2088-3446(+)
MLSAKPSPKTMLSGDGESISEASGLSPSSCSVGAPSPEASAPVSAGLAVPARTPPNPRLAASMFATWLRKKGITPTVSLVVLDFTSGASSHVGTSVRIFVISSLGVVPASMPSSALAMCSSRSLRFSWIAATMACFFSEAILFAIRAARALAMVLATIRSSSVSRCLCRASPAAFRSCATAASSACWSSSLLGSLLESLPLFIHDCIRASAASLPPSHSAATVPRPCSAAGMPGAVVVGRAWNRRAPTLAATNMDIFPLILFLRAEIALSGSPAAVSELKDGDLSGSVSDDPPLPRSAPSKVMGRARGTVVVVDVVVVSGASGSDSCNSGDFLFKPNIFERAFVSFNLVINEDEAALDTTELSCDLSVGFASGLAFFSALAHISRSCTICQIISLTVASNSAISARRCSSSAARSAAFSCGPACRNPSSSVVGMPLTSENSSSSCLLTCCAR